MKKVTLTLLGVFLISLAPLFSDDCRAPDPPSPSPGEKEKSAMTQPLKTKMIKKSKTK